MKKPRLGRPPGRKAALRPPLTARVSEEFYARVKESARQNGRTISEELMFRAAAGFEFADAVARVQEFERMIDRNFDAALRARGYTPVQDVTGVFWLSPGMPIPQRQPLSPELRDAITEAVRQALTEAKGA